MIFASEWTRLASLLDIAAACICRKLGAPPPQLATGTRQAKNRTAKSALIEKVPVKVSRQNYWYNKPDTVCRRPVRIQDTAE